MLLRRKSFPFHKFSNGVGGRKEEVAGGLLLMRKKAKPLLYFFLSRNYKGGTCLLLLLWGFGMDCAPRSWPLHPVYPFHQEAHTCRFHPKTLHEHQNSVSGEEEGD